MEPEPPMTQKNNQQAESPMYVNINQQDNNKGTVKTDMMWNDHVPAEEYADIEQEEETENAGKGQETENSQEDKTVKEDKPKIKPEPAQEETAEEEDTVKPEQVKADQETLDSVEKEVYEDNANVENKTRDLDIESMLAAIHNDNPTNSGDT